MPTSDIRVRIGSDERSLAEADAQWFHQSLQLRENDGARPCVEVTIQTDEVNVRLATDGCRRGGGGRPPNAPEQQIIDLWNHYGLSEPDADLEKAWAFLQRLRALFGLRAA